MIFFRFLKWWWGTIPPDTKLIVPLCMYILGILVLLGLGIISPNAVLLISTGISLFILFLYFKNEWEKYNKIQDREAIEIMRKLSGKPRESQYNEIEKRKQAYTKLIKEFKQNTPIV